MLKLDLDIDMFNIYLIVLLTFIAFLYMCVDVNYFLRVAFTVGYGRFFEKPVKLDGTSTIHAYCTLNDVDLLLTHMNNARYIREADFGRFHFFERTGLYKAVSDASGHIMQGACNIRYRKPIRIFSAYKVTTKVIYWDEKNLYFEQQFVTSDGFIRAILISQNKLINLNVAETICNILGKDVAYRPEVPEELKLWVSSMEASSNRLRKKE